MDKVDTRKCCVESINRIELLRLWMWIKPVICKQVCPIRLAHRKLVKSAHGSTSLDLKVWCRVATLDKLLDNTNIMCYNFLKQKWHHCYIMGKFSPDVVETLLCLQWQKSLTYATWLLTKYLERVIFLNIFLIWGKKRQSNNVWWSNECLSNKFDSSCFWG